MLQKLECLVRSEGLLMLGFASDLCSLSLKKLCEVEIRVLTLHLADLIVKVSFFLGCALVKDSTDFGS